MLLFFEARSIFFPLFSFHFHFYIANPHASIQLNSDSLDPILALSHAISWPTLQFSETLFRRYQRVYISLTILHRRWDSPYAIIINNDRNSGLSHSVPENTTTIEYLQKIYPRETSNYSTRYHPNIHHDLRYKRTFRSVWGDVHHPPTDQFNNICSSKKKEIKV